MRMRRTTLAAALVSAAATAAVTVPSQHPAVPVLPVSYSQARQLPHGFWWRTVTGRVGDCGTRKLTRQHPGVIIGYGPGDMQAALYCPPPPWSNGTVNPS